MDVIVRSVIKSKAFLPWFVFASQWHSASISLCEGSFLSHNAPETQQQDSRSFVKMSFVVISASRTRSSRFYSLLKALKLWIWMDKIWWLLVERMGVARAKCPRNKLRNANVVVAVVYHKIWVCWGFSGELLLIIEHTGPSNLYFLDRRHIRNKISLKDSSWTPLEYLWMLINMFTLTMRRVIRQFPLNRLLFS